MHGVVNWVFEIDIPLCHCYPRIQTRRGERSSAQQRGLRLYLQTYWSCHGELHWPVKPVKIQRLWKLFRPHPNSTMLAWASRHPASSWIMIGTRSIFYHLSDAEYLVNIQSTEQWYGTEGMEFSNTRLLGIVLHAVIRDYSVCWSTIICSRSIPADPSQLEEACVGVYREIRSPGVPRGTAVQVEPTSE